MIPVFAGRQVKFMKYDWITSKIQIYLYSLGYSNNKNTKVKVLPLTPKKKRLVVRQDAKVSLTFRYGRFKNWQYPILP